MMCRECIGEKDEKSIRFGLHAIWLFVRYLLQTSETSPDVVKMTSSLYYPVVGLKDLSPDVRRLKNGTIKILKQLYKERHDINKK